MNPHAHLYIDVKAADGKMRNWNLELGSLPMLERMGWRKDTVKVGDLVTVDAWLSKTSDTMANMKSVKLIDGRELFGGSSILGSGAHTGKSSDKYSKK
jgi:hypothetical protein